MATAQDVIGLAAIQTLRHRRGRLDPRDRVGLDPELDVADPIGRQPRQERRQFAGRARQRRFPSRARPRHVLLESVCRSREVDRHRRGSLRGDEVAASRHAARHRAGPRPHAGPVRGAASGAILHLGSTSLALMARDREGDTGVLLSLGVVAVVSRWVRQVWFRWP